MDELGSGVRNVFKYGPVYTPGSVPELIEGDVFKTVIPIRRIEDVDILYTNDWETVLDEFVENWEKPLEMIFQDRYISASVIAEKTGLSSRTVQKQLAKMKDIGVIERVGADGGGYWIILENK